MRVLVVDDSVVFRSQIKAALQSVKDVEVVGTAANGKIAIDRLKQTSVDLMTLDLEMPEMNGIETLKEIRKQGIKVNVIVFSSLTTSGSEKTLEALSNGASDFVTKPQGEALNMSTAAERIGEQLLPKIRALVERKNFDPPSVATQPAISKPLASVTYVKKDLSFFKPSVIVIGSSTGGPPALEKVMREIGPRARCPILIAQHMPPIFTRTLAKRLGQVSGIPAAEGVDGEILENKIYVAPGDYHMSLYRDRDKVRIRVDQGPIRNSVRPAVDNLFESASEIFGPQTMGFILTGMGEDGRVGCQALKKGAGGVMIQTEESSVVWGMPGAVHDAKAFDRQGDLEEIRSVLSMLGKAA